jgi:hypothetical protein
MVEISSNAPMINQEKLIPNTIATALMIVFLRKSGDFQDQSVNMYLMIFRNITPPIAKLANVLQRFHNIYSGLSKLINSPYTIELSIAFPAITSTGKVIK